MRRAFKVSLGVAFMSAVLVTACASGTGADTDKKKFVNSEIKYNPTMSNMWEIIKQQVSATRNEPKPVKDIPLKAMTAAGLDSSSEDALFRLGHSSILMRLDGEYVLADPVFSERASPVQWAGPKRFHPTPISIEELPEIKAVVISHDHYDHLDKAAIEKLADKVEFFFTPLKVGDYLIEWGVDAEKVVQLDWWQSGEIGSLKFTATPTQHFSGRGLFDRDETLWASWVIKSEKRNLYFSGDSGYFSGFKEIGEKLGPFDVTMVETGAYNKLWSEIHMMPEESLQAHIDLKGKAMLPIHNGTFDLSLHDWYEPLERVSELAQLRGVTLLTPVFGDNVTIEQPESEYAWWRDVADIEETDIQQPKLAMEQ